MDVVSQWVAPFGMKGLDAILLALLLFGTVFFCLVRIGSVPANITESERNYESLPIAWPSIVILWSLLTIATRLVVERLPFDIVGRLHAATSPDVERTLFVVYLIGYCALWIVYFASISNGTMRTRTLRTFLATFAFNWREPPAGYLNELEFERIQRSKAGATTQTLAILAASAALILSLAIGEHDRLADLARLDAWSEVMLTLSTACALISFFCLIVSVDIFDTVFNKFHEDVEMKTLERLFRLSRNPKYLGLIFLFASIALFLAAERPVLGALSLAFAIFIGYSHWFPRLNARTGLQRFEWLLRAMLVVVPALMTFASF